MNDHSIRPTVSFQNDLAPTEVVDTPNYELTIVTYPVLSLPSQIVAEIFTNFLPTYPEPPSTWMVRTTSVSPYGISHEILFPFQLELEFGANRLEFYQVSIPFWEYTINEPRSPAQGFELYIEAMRQEILLLERHHRLFAQQPSMPSLPDLPTELLMEIVKCYPELLSEVDACLHGVHIDQFDGNDVLRTLSQTCRALRNIFFPVLWTRVRATFNARVLVKRNKMWTRTTMLERRMRGILTTPYVVPYIRSLSITVDECKKGDWRPMAAFIRVLDLLPRLQSLTILGVSMESINTAFELPWAKKVYPSIVALALPDDLAPILHCFPNVQTLTMSNRWYLTYRPSSGKLFSAARNRCKAIHTVNNLAVSAEAIKSLREAIPTVQHLLIWENVCWKLDILPLLEGMDNLSDLRIRCRAPRLNDPSRPLLVEAIAAAKRILQTSKAPHRKELRIQHLEDARPDDLVIREETLFVVGAFQ